MTTLSLVERLTQQAYRYMGDPCSPLMMEVAAHIEALERALKPFAKEAGLWGELVPDDWYPVFVEQGHWDARYYGSASKFAIGDLRNAASVLLKEQQ